jgi:hypothetical protein
MEEPFGWFLIVLRSKSLPTGFMIAPCFFLGLLIFHPLLFVPSIHAVIAIYMEREKRRHREIVEAIREHGAPKEWGK